MKGHFVKGFYYGRKLEKLKHNINEGPFNDGPFCERVLLEQIITEEWCMAAIPKKYLIYKVTITEEL